MASTVLRVYDDEGLYKTFAITSDTTALEVCEKFRKKSMLPAQKQLALFLFFNDSKTKLHSSAKPLEYLKPGATFKFLDSSTGTIIDFKEKVDEINKSLQTAGVAPLKPMPKKPPPKPLPVKKPLLSEQTKSPSQSIEIHDRQGFLQTLVIDTKTTSQEVCNTFLTERHLPLSTFLSLVSDIDGTKFVLKPGDTVSLFNDPGAIFNFLDSNGADISFRKGETPAAQTPTFSHDRPPPPVPSSSHRPILLKNESAERSLPLPPTRKDGPSFSYGNSAPPPPENFDSICFFL